MEKFTWGDTVKFKSNSDVKIKPGSLAEVVGIRQVETTEQEREFGSPIGTQIYLLEFEDGTSLEASERLIEKA